MAYSPRVSAPSSLDDPLPVDPLALFDEWLNHAVEQLRPHNPTAMVLATVDGQGQPDARMVICRGFDAREGWLVFYTDLDSAKGAQLASKPRASLVFYWDALQRQVRFSGPVTPAPAAQADAYFETRPPGARLAAWASAQSRPIGSRDELVAKQREVGQRFGDDAPRPPNWGGYRVWAETIEFWVGRDDRLHDRAHYRRTLTPDGSGQRAGPWTAQRLQP